MPVGITIELTPRLASTLVTVTGELDLSGYAFLRDGLLKVAADTPPCLIADITGLALNEYSPAAVFPLVARRIGDWPGIPFLLVTHQPAQLRALHDHGVDRFVPVHPDVEAAERRPVPIRRFAQRVLSRSDDAPAVARAFVRERAQRWGVPKLVYDGTLIATELVTNVIQHTTSRPEILLELRPGMLAVAVSDDSRRPAVLRESSGGQPGLGLRIVADAARVWGSSPRWSGGKIVWAVLATGRHRDLPDE
ncbi:ATP-binding protein [Amycolatopsis sp. NPDC049252]|uniref:ATP-binding protein n=1 Tax=Amycolatopsis sp. NPDC049252 TaxID=3363933 RepID=UPI003722424D